MMLKIISHTTSEKI